MCSIYVLTARNLCHEFRFSKRKEMGLCSVLAILIFIQLFSVEFS